MKSVLFSVVTFVTATLLKANEAIAGVLMQVIMFFFNGTRSIVANTGYAIMQVLNDGQIEEALALTDEQETIAALEEFGRNMLSQQTMELDLLQSATKVRDHAQREQNWTDRHSEALTAIGNALLNDCDWEEDSVHQYLKEIVESIEGLEYHLGDD